MACGPWLARHCGWCAVCAPSVGLHIQSTSGGQPSFGVPRFPPYSNSLACCGLLCFASTSESLVLSCTMVRPTGASIHRLSCFVLGPCPLDGFYLRPPPGMSSSFLRAMSLSLRFTTAMLARTCPRQIFHGPHSRLHLCGPHLSTYHRLAA
jgi:hypothetical protein